MDEQKQSVTLPGRRAILPNGNEVWAAAYGDLWVIQFTRPTKPQDETIRIGMFPLMTVENNITTTTLTLSDEAMHALVVLATGIKEEDQQVTA